MVSNKQKYALFCQETFVPLYSKPWYMDTVCGSENWDVWLFENGNQVMAAMPYYIENRGRLKHITKAPLAQNNGIIFNYAENLRTSSKQKFEEDVINAATEFIEGLGVDVYEQQYMPTFKNYLPFFWKRYSVIPRITYRITPDKTPEEIWSSFSSKFKNQIKKGQRMTKKITEVSFDEFISLYEKVYIKQGVSCPFSRDFLLNYLTCCDKFSAGKMFCAIDINGDLSYSAYCVFDERNMYYILGGVNPDSEKNNTGEALLYHCILYALQNNLTFDFEGSVIKGINHFFRKYEGNPTEYFRIRKVFNPEVVLSEAQEQAKMLKGFEDKNECFVHESSYIDDGVYIGKGTKIWHFCHVQEGAVIGENCSLGQNVNISKNVHIGNRVKIQNNVSVYEGVTLEDGVFCGPSMVFTNDLTPRAEFPKGSANYKKTLVKRGASIGANATIVCGHTLGEYCMIAAGAVVTKDVPPHALMAGVPAKQIGYVCECGEILKDSKTCKKCGKTID